jgi:GDP-L-fucose synthase
MSSLDLMSLSGKRIYVAGHQGMVGAAISRRLATEDCLVLTATRAETDLTRQAETETLLTKMKPDVVIIAAAKIGDSQANGEYPADFLAENLAIELNVIKSSFAAGVRRLLFVGSTSIYPRLAPQPVKEGALMTGPLEKTNEGHAIAKITGIKLSQAYRRQYGVKYISVMSTNLYGRGDNYDPDHGHVIAALIRRFHEAKSAGVPEVVVWGSGTPKREFLYVDDFADACIFVLKTYDGEEFLNVGLGTDIAIADLAQEIAAVVGYEGGIVFDPARPDGPPRKLVDASRLAALGWHARIDVRSGIRLAYDDFLHGGSGG